MSYGTCWTSARSLERGVRSEVPSLEFMTSHFLVLRRRPMACDRGITALRSSRTWSLDPPIVASSRYQTFNGDLTKR